MRLWHWYNATNIRQAGPDGWVVCPRKKCQTLFYIEGNVPVPKEFYLSKKKLEIYTKVELCCHYCGRSPHAK